MNTSMATQLEGGRRMKVGVWSSGNQAETELVLPLYKQNMVTCYQVAH
jgi:hypothetical protein